MAALALENMPTYVKDLRINELIPDVGHWTQQEAPEAAIAQRINEQVEEVGC